MAQTKQIKLQNLTLDFETYYDDIYSLSRMTTAQYVHDERFQVHGLGYQFENKEAHYLADEIEIQTFFNGIDWKNTRVIGHNLLFDGYILAEIYHCYAGQYTDTKYMAKGVLSYLKHHDLKSVAAYLKVGKKDRTALYNVKGKTKLTLEESFELGEYCKGDCEKSWRIYDRLFAYFSSAELELMSITTRMMVKPQFECDTNVLVEFLQELLEERKKLIAESGVNITTLRSVPKLISALEPYNIEIPTKDSPSNPGETIYTFEKDHPDVVMLLGHPKPEVRRIVRARLNVMSSIRINRAQRFIDTTLATGGPFPIPLVYCAAHTGRWGGSDKLNAQNLPEGPLRASLMAPPHHTVLVVDLSQIEARITAWLAEHFTLLEKYRNPKIDVYIDFAAEYYGVSIEDIQALGKKSKERFIGKVCTLGLGFGMGWKKLRNQFLTTFAWTDIRLTKEEAARAVELYRSINLPIKLFWDYCNNVIIPRMASAEDGVEYGYKCIQYGRNYIRLPSGRCLIYPNLRAEDGEWPDGQPKVDWVYDYKGGKAKIYGGKLTENLAQALARDLNGEFMLKIDPIYPIATMTHDENVIIPHLGRVLEAQEFMERVMTTPPIWAPDLPLAVEGAYNERYTK